MSKEIIDPPVGQGPPEATQARPGEEHRLKGDMGVAKLVFLVLGANAPLAIVAGYLALVIGFGGGVGSPLIFIGLGIVFVIFSVGYTVVATRIERAGAIYSYVTAGLGRPLGLGAGFVATMTYAIGIASLIPFVGISLDGMLSTFGIGGAPWWVWSLLFLVIVGILGYLRIDFSAKVIGVIVSLEIAVVLIYNAVIFTTVGAQGNITFGSFNPATLASGGVVIGLLFAFSSFSGFEATAIYRDEVRDPKRTIPRATYIAVSVVAVLYAITTWALIQSTGEENAAAVFGAAPGTAFTESVNQYIGTVASQIVALLLITSVFASLTGAHNILSRYMFNLGVDGILPRALGRPHPRRGSPHRASLVLSITLVIYVIVAAITGIDASVLFSTVSGIASFSLIFLLSLASIGIAVWLIRTKPDVNIWRRVIAPVISVILLVTIAVLVSQNITLLTGSALIGAIAIAIPFVFTALGIIVALVVRARDPHQYEGLGIRE